MFIHFCIHFFNYKINSEAKPFYYNLFTVVEDFLKETEVNNSCIQMHMGDSVVTDVTFAQKTPNNADLQICNQGLLGQIIVTV